MNSQTGLGRTGGGRRLPAFLTDKKYQSDPRYSRAVPQSRWYNIELEWRGRRVRFGMNINNFDGAGSDIRLGHVYEVDEVNDEWVEAPVAVLREARENHQLINHLFDSVRAQRQLEALSDDLDDDIIARDE